MIIRENKILNIRGKLRITHSKKSNGTPKVLMNRVRLIINDILPFNSSIKKNLNFLKLIIIKLDQKNKLSKFLKTKNKSS